MRTFKQGSWIGDSKCVLCKQTTEGEVVLVPIKDTEDGNICEAAQVHTKCLQDRWYFSRELGFILVKADD